MKNTNFKLANKILLASFLALTMAITSFTNPDERTEKKGKNKDEKIKELTIESNQSDKIDDFEIFNTPSIKIYNSNDLLVYEDNVSSIEDIKEVNLKRCFSKCSFLMNYNNTNYYIINN